MPKILNKKNDQMQKLKKSNIAQNVCNYHIALTAYEIYNLPQQAKKQYLYFYEKYKLK